MACSVSMKVCPIESEFEIFNKNYGKEERINLMFKADHNMVLRW